MTANCLEYIVLVIVPDSKLLTRFTYNGSYLWIVDLTHSREQVMGSLVVKGAWQKKQEKT